ncbi:A-kinase anchor protein 9, partial [Lemmus lemmus]
MEDLKSRHKREMEETLHRCANLYGEREQFLQATVNELHMELQYTHYHNMILWDELQAAKLENCALHYKCESLSKQSRSLQDQIMQLKLDLEQKYMIQMEDLESRHKREMEETLHRCANLYGVREQFLHAIVNELHMKLQYTHYHNKKLRDELQAAKLEKCALHYKCESPSEQSRSLKDQLRRAEQRVSGLQYGAEQTNYKVKLEMVEKKENDTVLCNKTESKGDELNGLRTQLLNHEEELSKLKGDLEVEHRSNTENLIKKQ